MSEDHKEQWIKDTFHSLLSRVCKEVWPERRLSVSLIIENETGEKVGARMRFAPPRSGEIYEPQSVKMIASLIEESLRVAESVLAERARAQKEKGGPKRKRPKADGQIIQS